MSRRCDRERISPPHPRPMPVDRWEWDPLRPRVMWAEWRDEDGSTPLPAAVVANRARVVAHLREPVALPTPGAV